MTAPGKRPSRMLGLFVTRRLAAFADGAYGLLRAVGRWVLRTPSRTLYLNTAIVFLYVEWATGHAKWFGAAAMAFALSALMALHDIAAKPPVKVVVEGLSIHADGKPVSLTGLTIHSTGAQPGIRVENTSPWPYKVPS